MINLKISLPVYKSSSWNKLVHEGTIEVSSDVDSLSEGYIALKLKIDELLRDMNLRVHIAGKIEDLDLELSSKEEELKTLEFQIQRATAQHERLREFLRNMGIDAADSYLTYHPTLLPGSQPKTVEVIGDDDDDDEY
jgi:hypothetical protein